MDPAITGMLDVASRGDAHAQAQLFTLLYDELRRCAHRQLAGAQATLSTTALVNETYVKLVAAADLRLESRRHFMALSARAMRQVLVDHARRSGAERRGGDASFVTLDDDIAHAPHEAFEVLALDRALGELEGIDARAARVVQLHFFGGLTFAAIAELEGLNERTVKRDWQAARHVLAQIMGRAG
jgi:RNA polymerase sigma factor (TIGR02999 family)